MAPAPARERGWLLRAIVLVVGGWAFSVAFALAVCVVALVTPRRRLQRVRPRLLAVWGRSMLRLSGVRLEVEGRERLLVGGPRVVTFNHASVLDAYAISTLMPPGATVTIKRELLFYPVLGLAAWLVGLVAVDRGRSERAHRTLQRAAERMQRDGLAVFIAPEGTRSRDGELRPFKKGALHLALATGAPIIPIVLDGSFALQPRKQFWSRRGVIRARVLPPVDTRGLTREGIGAATQRLRERYLRELAAMRASPAPDEPPLSLGPRSESGAQCTSSTILP